MLTRHHLIDLAVEFLKGLPADGAPAKDVAAKPRRRAYPGRRSAAQRTSSA
jgi:hypothetical protein